MRAQGFRVQVVGPGLQGSRSRVSGCRGVGFRGVGFWGFGVWGFGEQEFKVSGGAKHADSGCWRIQCSARHLRASSRGQPKCRTVLPGVRKWAGTSFSKASARSIWGFSMTVPESRNLHPEVVG